MKFPKLLVVVVGPTASGKTDLSIRLAQYFETEIISADSRQFYREMNIGTAKPDRKELASVKHHFINTLSIYDPYNASLYEHEALPKINEIFENRDLAILTGGSGLYIGAVCNGIDEMPEVDLAVRSFLNEELHSKGLDYLTELLKEKDPEYYKEVNLTNPIRVVRALEVCLTSGKPFSSFRKNQKTQRNFHILKIGLEWDREELYQRINERMDKMVSEGLFEEAERLLSFRKMSALKTVGYKEIFDYLDNLYDWDEAVRLLKRNSRHYAKRQMTWFKKDPDIKWFHPDKFKEVITLIEAEITLIKRRSSQ